MDDVLVESYEPASEEEMIDWELIFTKTFPLPQGMFLWNLATLFPNKSVIVWTAKDSKMTCAEPLQNWIRDNLGAKIEVILVSHPKMTTYLSGPRKLLIDSSKQNCDDWESAGGSTLFIQHQEETVCVDEHQLLRS